jgi:hypothetical protein
MLRSKHPIKHLGERIRPRHPFGGLYIHQPNRNFEFGVLVQHGLNPLKELPNDSGQGTASHQLPWRGLDQMRDGGEGVGGHRDYLRFNDGETRSTLRDS